MNFDIYKCFQHVFVQSDSPMHNYNAQIKEPILLQNQEQIIT